MNGDYEIQEDADMKKNVNEIRFKVLVGEKHDFGHVVFLDRNATAAKAGKGDFEVLVEFDGNVTDMTARKTFENARSALNAKKKVEADIKAAIGDEALVKMDGKKVSATGRAMLKLVEAGYKCKINY